MSRPEFIDNRNGNTLAAALAAVPAGLRLSTAFVRPELSRIGSTSRPPFSARPGSPRLSRTSTASKRFA